MSHLLLSTLLFVSAILLTNLVAYGARKREIPGLSAFSVLMLAMIVHTVGYAFELLSPTQEQMYFWIRIEYIGVAFYPFLILLFARSYADEKKYANKMILSFMFGINALTFIFVNTNAMHHFYYTAMAVESSIGFPVLALEKGMWYYVQVVSLYASIFYSVFLFSVKLKKTRGDYRKKVLFMLIGVSAPMLTFVIYMLGLGPIYIDVSPFSYLFMSLFIILGLVRYDILFLSTVTHEMVFNAIDEAVLVIDEDGLLINFNEAAGRFFKSLATIKIGDSVNQIWELEGFDLKLSQKQLNLGEKILKFKMLPIKNSKAKIYVVSDITKSEKIKEQLEALATKDDLTGLYNRRYFMTLIKSEVSCGYLMILDIDHFKQINDTYGHLAGDEVLKSVGEKMNRSFQNHILCRYGGEEFAVYFKTQDTIWIAKQIEFLQASLMSKELPIQLTFSAGLAICKPNEVQEALAQADEKLYEAKRLGRNRVIF